MSSSDSTASNSPGAMRYDLARRSLLDRHRPQTRLENPMALAPIEVLVISFPGNQFSGEIIPEIEVTEQDVETFYTDNPEAFRGSDRIHSRHIHSKEHSG